MPIDPESEREYEWEPLFDSSPSFYILLHEDVDENLTFRVYKDSKYWEGSELPPLLKEAGVTYEELAQGFSNRLV